MNLNTPTPERGKLKVGLCFNVMLYQKTEQFSRRYGVNAVHLRQILVCDVTNRLAARLKQNVFGWDNDVNRNVKSLTAENIE